MKALSENIRDISDADNIISLFAFISKYKYMNKEYN